MNVNNQPPWRSDGPFVFEERVTQTKGLTMEQTGRAVVLLTAARDIIKNTPADMALEATAIWDDAECDGACLVDEITEWLEGLE